MEMIAEYEDTMRDSALSEYVSENKTDLMFEFIASKGLDDDFNAYCKEAYKEDVDEIRNKGK